MPFIMPLLWVAARYGSASANLNADNMASLTTSPPISSVFQVALAIDSRLSARFDKILILALVSVQLSNTGDNASTIELTAFAPIASQVFTKICTMTLYS